MDYARRQRVMDAVYHKSTDRTPTDFQGVSEIWAVLKKHFRTDSMKDILDALEIDCAWADPEVARPATERDSEGLLIGWGGSRIREVYNQYGKYDEIVRYALAGCETPEEVDERLCLPDLKDWDFSSVQENCRIYDDRFIIGGYASSFYYPTLVMSMEELLTDMYTEPELVHHIIKRCVDWHMEYHEKMLKAGGGRIDAMQIADDFATQRGPLISRDMFREFFRKPIKEFVSLAESYGAIPYLHCCGSAYGFIEEFIDLGIKILDPVQTVAADMQPEKLKREFGKDICFHGAGETQRILPTGTEEEVKENARMLCRVLGDGGGYILTSCHIMQADVPLKNILAFYDVENRS